jgi:uncharacterized protein YfcZ (UPF0381/DUF406 family)
MTRLRYVRDTVAKSISAHCDVEGCFWSKSPLPVWTVDSDLYREVPSLVIGTVDKFAQLARNAESGVIFGGGGRFRKPDLIIQDELHLISGPLGTMTGLYEVAIDRLCTKDGVVPKIIASTATIRQASTQIRALFDRSTCLFPSPVLDAGNSGFAVEDAYAPGRLHLGVTTSGRSGKFALQAVAASLIQTAGSPDMPDDTRDDFWTTIAYFNSLRELGGTLVLMNDDVIDSIKNIAARRGETPRDIAELIELTSRVGSSELKKYLDQLERRHGDPECCDVALASNMISVGVDVPRLGSMIVFGQPKGMAEYIQATSRVGRRKGGPGGIVITLYNNGKNRDRAHYETFQTWHRAMYRQVEATSVTPFAPRARGKALHAVLVILARHLIGSMRDEPRNAPEKADELNRIITEITKRARSVDSDEAVEVEEELLDFLEKWIGSSSELESYWKERTPNKSLLIGAEKASEIRANRGMYVNRAEPTPNSMRNVEPGTMFKLLEER